MPLAAYLYLCLMLGFDQESYLINGWKQGIFISLVVQDDELQPRSLCSIDERLPHMHFRAGQMVSTKGQRRNGLRHKLYQKCKHQHQHFHWTMFRTGNGQLNGNKEMEQQVRPTLISNKVTFGLKQAKKTKFGKHSISTYCNTVGNFILAFFQFRSQPTVAAKHGNSIWTK